MQNMCQKGTQASITRFENIFRSHDESHDQKVYKKLTSKNVLKRGSFRLTSNYSQFYPQVGQIFLKLNIPCIFPIS